MKSENEKDNYSDKKSCYSCLVILDKSNRSEEHIIPNAIGGRQKSNQLLCRACNNDFGSKFEGTFIKELSFFSGCLPIKRERGNNKKFRTVDKITNLPIVIDSKGVIALAHPIVEEKPVDPSKEGQFRIKVPDEKSGKKFAEDIINNYKEKYPFAKIGKPEFERKESQEDSYIEYFSEFGSLSFFKTVQKCLLNLFISKGGNYFDVENEAHALFNEDDKFPMNWLLTCNMPNESNLNHVLVVIGNPEEKLLYGYAEFFGGLSVISVLNENYKGPECFFSYCINPLCGEEKSVNVQVSLSREHILDIIKKREINFEQFSQQLMVIESKIRDIHPINEIVKKTLSKYKSEEVEMMDIVNELSFELLEYFKPRIEEASKMKREKARKEFSEKLEKFTLGNNVKNHAIRSQPLKRN